MKLHTLITALFCALAVTMYSQPPKGDALPGDSYGATISSEGADAIAVVAERVNAPDTLPVKVKARVLEVCKQKGCWMTLQVNDSTEAFVKMKDYGFFVPTALEGKTIVLEGIAFIKTTSVAELKHYAEDGGKSKKDIDAITQPESQLRLLANGILVAE